MTMVRAIIVDDELLAIDGVRRQCDDSGRIEVVGTANDGPTALSLIRDTRPQAIFLDIAMPGMTGLDVAHALRTGGAGSPRVILVTAHDHFATEAFDLAVIDYVLKPIDPARLQRAIDRLHKAVEAETASVADDIWVPFRGSLVRLPVEHIRRIEAERDYVRLFTHERSYLQRIPLAEILDRLGDRFIRIHRSSAVPTSTISGLRHIGGGSWTALCTDGEQVAVGRTYLSAVRRRLCLPD